MCSTKSARRAAGAAMAGHMMSMLQHLQRSRGLETGALVEAVQEAGRLTGTPTPMLDTVLALVRERALHGRDGPAAEAGR